MRKDEDRVPSIGGPKLVLYELAIHLGLVNGSHALADVEKASGDRVAHTLTPAPSDVLSYQFRSTSNVLLGSPRPRESARSFLRSACLQLVPSMDDTSTDALYSSRRSRGQSS